MLIYGTIGIFRRYIPLPSASLAFFRGATGSLFLVLLVKLQKKKVFHGIGARKTAGLILSGILIGFNWIFLFEAYNKTTVAVATLCYYMQPTIVILLSPMIFREKLTLKKACCAAVAIIGMVFISGIMESGIPSFSGAEGILFGLAAATLYAIVVIMNKKLPGIDPYEKTILQLASAAVILIPYLGTVGGFSAFGELNGSAVAICMLLIVGLLHTGVAYALYFGSMEKLRIQTVAILSYLDPIAALILSAVILHERMTLYGGIGAILILGAAFISEI